MRWSSPIKNKKQEADQNTTVLEYKPRDFILGTPEVALDYLDRKKQGLSDFVLSDVIRVTTGVQEIERETEENLIEQKVLERLKDIQKLAYDEGYKLGQDEGFNEAFAKNNKKINDNLLELDQIIQSIVELKSQLVTSNENYIIQLVYQIAEKLAYDHIEKNPEVIIEVIKKSVDTAQADEDITVVVSPEQVNFIEKFKSLPEKKFDFLRKIKIVSSDQVETGGCRIETNYGVIDATLKQRFNKIWSEIQSAIPKVNDNTGS